MNLTLPPPAAKAAGTKAIGGVTASQPVSRRYRAVLVRTKEERAIVEFDALETDVASPYQLAPRLIPMVGEADWVEQPRPSYPGDPSCNGYVDRIEAI